MYHSNVVKGQLNKEIFFVLGPFTNRNLFFDLILRASHFRFWCPSLFTTNSREGQPLHVFLRRTRPGRATFQSTGPNSIRLCCSNERKMSRNHENCRVRARLRSTDKQLSVAAEEQKAYLIRSVVRHYLSNLRFIQLTKIV
jgi:hypothetical protein